MLLTKQDDNMLNNAIEYKSRKHLSTFCVFIFILYYTKNIAANQMIMNSFWVASFNFWTLMDMFYVTKSFTLVKIFF